MINNFNKAIYFTLAVMIISSAQIVAASEAETIGEIVKFRLNVDKTAVGAAIAIIDGDKIEYLTYGLTSKEKQQATTSDTLFEIGSISKTFTSIALASMVIEGKVALSDPAQKYLPDGVIMPIRNGKPITLASLANHSSGLPRLPTNMPYGNPEDPYADYTVAMMYEFLNSHELIRDAGEKMEYSNLAVGLLGHLLALIDHKTYQEMITERVLIPLQMTNTFIDVPNSHLKLLSDGHDNSLKKAMHWQLPALAGAGAIKSSINDMAFYLMANINQQPLAKAISLTHKQSIDFGETGPVVGLAWIKTNFDNDQKGSYLWHNGGTGGFRSFIGFDKTNKRGIVILENSANGMDEIGNAYLSGTLNQLKDDYLQVVIVDEVKLKRLKGEYELMPGFIMSVTNEDGKLYIQATGQPKFEVIAKSDLEFINRAAKARITFELDKNGQGHSLTLHQGGLHQKAPKLSKTRTKTQQEVTLSQLELDNVIGEFELTPNFVITTTHENGQLHIQATGQSKIPFSTKSKAEFFNQMLSARIIFELDSNGKAVSLTLFQGGQELKGKKK